VNEWTGETLGDGSPSAAPGDCSPGDGYDDVGRGASVTVYDETNQVIGVGSLLRGSLVDVERNCAPPLDGVDPIGGWYRNGYCRFTFRVELDRVATFYGVEVSDRGAVTFSAEQPARDENQVALSLG
jgi:hypothetical protein